MAYIFIDDQTPEARDYESNYVFFHEDNIDSVVEALARVRSMERRSPRPLTAEIALLERTIARRRLTLATERYVANAADLDRIWTSLF